MIINRKEYREKVLGCWMGKNIGGTLGAPFEWYRQINSVNFYTQDLCGEPLPNDDLDIQLLWLIALEEKGLGLNAKVLGDYWLMYVTPFWNEYGNAKINMSMGLMPPLSGNYKNNFKNSCGAFIRSEIWACIAPGLPHISAKYALEDAMIDHGDGEGTYAEVFCAVIESAAFIEKDVNKLIQIGLSYIPENCAISSVVNTVIDLYKSKKTWKETRDILLEKFRGKAQCICDDDKRKGFEDGDLGWDAPSNIGIIILGLLYGQGDFAKSICTAVNCGEDTDCTAATVGAILGIINGIGGIEQKWIDPIGHKIKTACLNIGNLGSYGSQLPATVEELTDRTEKIAQRLIIDKKIPLKISENEATLFDFAATKLFSTEDYRTGIYENLNGPTFSFDFFDIVVDYGDSPTVTNGTPKKICLKIKNNHVIQCSLNIRWYLPDSWTVSPDEKANMFVWQPLGKYQNIEFELYCDKVPYIVNRFVIEVTVSNRHTTMLVPVVLVNKNVPSY